MSWVSVATAVAGFVIQQYASEQQASKQQKLANSMELYKRTKAQEASAATEDYLKTMDPAARENDRQVAQSDLRRDYTAGVDATKKFETPDNFAGKVSPDYKGVADRAKSSTAQRIQDAIGQLATIGAPAQRDLKNASTFTNAAGRVGAAQTASANVGDVYGTAINNVRPDPYLNFAGQLVAGVGSSGVLNKKKAPIDVGGV